MRSVVLFSELVVSHSRRFRSWLAGLVIKNMIGDPGKILKQGTDVTRRWQSYIDTPFVTSKSNRLLSLAIQSEEGEHERFGTSWNSRSKSLSFFGPMIFLRLLDRFW